MTPEGNKATIFELADTMLKSWWTVVAGICLGLAGGVVALANLPEIFEASTKIRFAPQTISESMARSAINDDMSRRLLEIEEAILSRDYMDKLIEKNFGVPTDEVAREALIRKLRNRVSVSRRSGTRVAELTYMDRSAKRSASVINNLTDLYVEQNKQYRTLQAERTREDFEQRALDARGELDEIETKLTEFNTQHRLETGAFLDANLQLLENRQDDLESNLRSQTTSEERLLELQTRRDQGEWSTDPTDGLGADPRARRIRDIQLELEDLRSRYSEDHPDVRHAKTELADLIAAADPDGKKDAPAYVDPELEALQQSIRRAEDALEELKITEKRVRREIGELEMRIRNTPEIQDRLDDLDAQRRDAEQRYRDARNKAELARESEFLEESEQAQRLEIIERAVVPFAPSSPDPMRIYMVGVVMGLLLFVGPVVLRSLLNPLVSSEAGLRALVDVPVLVSIPRIVTLDTSGVGRKRFLKNISLAFAFSALLVAVFMTIGQQ